MFHVFWKSPEYGDWSHESFTKLSHLEDFIKGTDYEELTVIEGEEKNFTLEVVWS